MRISKPMKKTLLAAIMIAGGLAACGGAAPPEEAAAPRFDVTAANAGDRITINPESGATYIDVRSKRGIGQAEVALRRGTWPENLSLRFHLAGLEGLQIDYSDTQLALSVTSSGHILQSADAAGDVETETAVDSPYWMDVTIAEGEEYVVSLPADFHAQAPDSFAFRWIDFYR